MKKIKKKKKIERGEEKDKRKKYIVERRGKDESYGDKKMVQSTSLNHQISTPSYWHMHT